MPPEPTDPRRSGLVVFNLGCRCDFLREQLRQNGDAQTSRRPTPSGPRGPGSRATASAAQVGNHSGGRRVASVFMGRALPSACRCPIPCGAPRAPAARAEKPAASLPRGVGVGGTPTGAWQGRASGSSSVEQELAIGTSWGLVRGAGDYWEAA